MCLSEIASKLQSYFAVLFVHTKSITIITQVGIRLDGRPLQLLLVCCVKQCVLFISLLEIKNRQNSRMDGKYTQRQTRTRTHTGFIVAVTAGNTGKSCHLDVFTNNRNVDKLKYLFLFKFKGAF